MGCGCWGGCGGRLIRRRRCLINRLAQAVRQPKVREMTRLFLIRHGEAAAAWGGDARDPGLSEAGREQAKATAKALAAIGAFDIVSSPMARCLETSAAYAELIARERVIEPRVSEVVAPASVSDRRAWLRENFPWDAGVQRRQWSSVDPALRAWRDDVAECVLELKRDTAVFSHFIAINALASVATKSQDTIVCVPGYASINEFEIRDGSLHLVRLGESMVQGEVR